MEAGKRLDICMVVPGMAFHGHTDRESSLGGSESAGLYMARALAAKGHCLTMFCNCPQPGNYDGVQYLPLEQWDEATHQNPHDVLIIQRMPGAFGRKRASRLNISWLHDMAQGRKGAEYTGVAWNVDNYIVLSDYHQKQIAKATGLPESIFYKSRNGIDTEQFSTSKIGDVERDPKRIIYAARPERGLDTLLDEVFPRILKQMPDVTLAIAGYENYAEHMRPFYERISYKTGTFGDRVEFLGYLAKPDFYRELARSSLYVYPTPSIEPGFEKFNEISCIAAMETQAAGTPMVATARGALPETLDLEHNALIDEGDDFFDRFAGRVVELLKKPDVLKTMSAGARAFALEQYDWNGVADDWCAMFEQRIAENNDNPVRRFVHMVEQNDIMAAREEYEEHGERIESAHVAAKALDTYRRYVPMLCDETRRERYEQISANIKDDEAERAIRDTPYSTRFNYLLELPIPENAKVLDYGCWCGHMAINLAGARPDLFVVGVDMSKRAVSKATKLAKASGVEKRTHFITGEVPAMETSRDFDIALLFEVLEHVAEPWALLDSVEEHCQEGALISLTVPYGPWEAMQQDPIHRYQHLWNFDLHDLREMLQHKKNLQVAMRPAQGRCAKTDEPVGWYMISYRKTEGCAASPINLERKRSMMRPRQTVTGSMIVGGEIGSNIAAWGMEPLAELVDDLVVADCGMNDVALAACERFGARVVPGVDPNQEGFDAARNIALKECDGDFAIWIDGDERIVAPAAFSKYLRQNIFNSYQVVQNHLTVENDHDADLPARILRLAPDEQGRTFRFHGVVHEHPELALNEGPGLALLAQDLQLAHVGYMTGAERNKRFERNLPLHLRDREKHSERYLTKLFIMRENTIQARRMIQAAGALTPEARKLCEEAIEVGRKNFLGKGEQFARSKWLQYYGEALRMLGIGAVVAFGFAGGADNAKIEKMSIGQFASIDEAERELCSRLRAECEKYFREDW